MTTKEKEWYAVVLIHHHVLNLISIHVNVLWMHFDVFFLKLPHFPLFLGSLETPMPRRGVDSPTANGSGMNEMINSYDLMMHSPHHMPSSPCLTSLSMIS